MSNWIKTVCKGFAPPTPSSLTVTVTGAVTTRQGSIVVVVSYGNNASVSVGSVTDTQGNTYVLDYAISTTATSGRGLEFWRCQDPTALTTSDSITASLNGGTCDHGINLIADLYARLGPPVVTVTAPYTGAFSTTSAVSITPLASDSVAIAAAAFNNTESSETVAAPFTIGTANVTSVISCATAWDDNPGSSSITATFTGSTTHTSVAAAVTYQTSQVQLTTPNLGLAAPLLTATGGGPVSVSLTTPNLALVAPLLSPVVSPSPVQFEFVASNAAGGSTSYPSTAIASTVNGSTLVVGIATSVPVISVTDSKANTYAPMLVNGSLTVWQSINARPLLIGVDTVTATLAFPGATGIDIVGVAFPPGWIFDLQASAGGPSAASATSGTVNYPAVGAYGEAILSFAWDLSNSTINFNSPALLLGPAQGGNSAGWLIAGVNTAPDDEPNSVTATWSPTSSVWAMVSIAYRLIPQALLQGPVAPPSFPTPLYTFLATDLVSGSILGELPLNSVSFDAQLNTAGNLSANANLDDPRMENSIFIGATQPGRTAIYAYRNNTIVWGGIIWTRQWQSIGKTFAFSGQTFESYAARRYPRSWLGKGQKVYKNTGQIGIINALWHFMQDVTNGSIGVRTLRPDDFPSNDVQRNLTINGFDLSMSFDDLIQSIIQLDDGPDYTITWSTDSNGLPIKQLVLAQTIGNPIGTTDLVVDYPGTIKDYQYIEDASSGANQWWTAGAGTGASAVVGQATSQTSLSAGYPLIESVDSESITTVANSQTTVNKYANADLKAFPVPFVTHAVDLFSTQGPQFGTYGLGDRATFNVIDPRFPNGLQFSVRVIGWTVTLPDTGNGPEQVSLVFDEQTTPGPNTG